MDSTERKSITYQCEKLGGLAHANVEYFHGEESGFLLGFECDQAVDCRIRRSFFSGSPNYTIDCPIYNDLEKNLT